MHKHFWGNACFTQIHKHTCKLILTLFMGDCGYQLYRNNNTLALAWQSIGPKHIMRVLISWFPFQFTLNCCQCKTGILDGLGTSKMDAWIFYSLTAWMVKHYLDHKFDHRHKVTQKQDSMFLAGPYPIAFIDIFSVLFQRKTGSSG